MQIKNIGLLPDKQDKQNKGYGSILLKELEKRVKEKGAAGIELQAVKDEMHGKYYGKLSILVIFP